MWGQLESKYWTDLIDVKSEQDAGSFGNFLWALQQFGYRVILIADRVESTPTLKGVRPLEDQVEFWKKYFDDALVMHSSGYHLLEIRLLDKFENVAFLCDSKK